MLTFVSSITRQSQTHTAEKRESMARITNLSKGFGLESKEHWRLVKCALTLNPGVWRRAERFRYWFSFSSPRSHHSEFWTLTSGIKDSKILAQLPVQLRGEILKNIHADGILYTAASHASHEHF